MWQSSCAMQQIKAAGIDIYSNSVLIFSKRKWPPALLALILGSVRSAASEAAWSLVAEQSLGTHCITSVAHLLATRKTLKLSNTVTNNQLIHPHEMRDVQIFLAELNDCTGGDILTHRNLFSDVAHLGPLLSTTNRSCQHTVILGPVVLWLNNLWFFCFSKWK